MLRFPGDQTVESFLAHHWQKKPLFMPGGLQRLHPSISRNELGWLASLEDVESRIVFVERRGTKTNYRVETGPFDSNFLRKLPKRDWTLLVHDVEKHIPAMRRLFECVPFIPDWRIDDLMVSFAAPGGGVGPHRDNYDVFLCQGIGERRWRYTAKDIEADDGASADIALLKEFTSTETYDASAGDVLYLPPLVAHWGIATRACMTYSIGMRAPQASELLGMASTLGQDNEIFYSDDDLASSEARPGLITGNALRRAEHLVSAGRTEHLAGALGCCVTQTKTWLTPETVRDAELESAMARNRRLVLHGMTRLAFDESNVYVNGRYRSLPASVRTVLSRLCVERTLSRQDTMHLKQSDEGRVFLQWLISHGAFDLP